MTSYDALLLKGIERFNSGDFFSASEIFQGIASEKRYPVKLMYNLSKCYGQWEFFDYGNARQYLEGALEYQGISSKSIFPESSRKHVRILQLLETSYIPSSQTEANCNLSWLLIGDLIANAQRRIHGHRYDLAVLLLYRAMEFFTHWRLSQKGIDASEACYSHLCFEQSRIIDSLNDLGALVYVGDFNRLTSLPSKLGLMNGLLLLRVLEDSMITSWDLKEILSLAELRNSSILTHGLKIITEEDALRFFHCVMQKLDDVWHPGNFEEYLTFHEFIQVFTFPQIDCQGYDKF